MKRHLIIWLCAVVLGGCDRAAPTGVEPPGGVRIRIDLGGLHRAVVGGRAVDCVSSVDSVVYLRVEPEGGAAQSYTRAIPSDGSGVTFEGIAVETGRVVFTATVLGNGGDVLYEGRTPVDIRGDAFEVAIALAKRHPVLRVCPGVLVLAADTAAFLLANRGAGGDALTWELVPPAPGCDKEDCVLFSPEAGTLAPAETAALVVRRNTVGEAVLRARIASNAGFADIEVRVESVPVRAENDAATTDEERPVRIDVLGNDFGPAPGGLTIAGFSPPESGTVAVAGSAVVYTPGLDFSGTDRFTYTVEDARGATDEATVMVRVNACIDFDALPRLTRFDGTNATPGGTIFTENETRVFLFDFAPTGGATRPFDYARVVSALVFEGIFGTGQVMETSHANLGLFFAGGNVRYLRFDFLDRGGAENFALNELPLHVASAFSDKMPVPPGMTLSVPTRVVGGDLIGTVLVRAPADTPIEAVRMGGQELYLEEICFGAEGP